MKLTDALRGEHGVLLTLMAHCERSAPSWELADILLAGRALEAALLSHAKLEDELLFRTLIEREVAAEPARAMEAEHREIDRRLAAVLQADDEALARRALESAIALAREHFHREEVVLFTLAERTLESAWLERLAGEWATHRGVALAPAAVA